MYQTSLVQVSAVTKFHTVFATIIQHAVVMGYSLFLPQGCVIPPDTFCVDWIHCLIVDNALVFMHQYTFTAVSLYLFSRTLFYFLTGQCTCYSLKIHQSIHPSCPNETHMVFALLATHISRQIPMSSTMLHYWCSWRHYRVCIDGTGLGKTHKG